MCGKLSALKQVNWENIKSRFGYEKFADRMQSAHFVGFVNWTMLTSMNEIWAAIQKEVCPKLTGPRRKVFFDLADPEKRTREDVLKALGLITEFEKYFDAILGLNEKEAYEIGAHLELDTKDRSPEGLLKLAQQIHERIMINTVVVHPVHYALAVSAGDSAIVEGPFTPKPLITTGAGDHFNAGFCLGKLLGFDNAKAVLTGVSTSGHAFEAQLFVKWLFASGCVQNNFFVISRKINKPGNHFLAQAMPLVGGMNGDVTNVRAILAIGQRSPRGD
jgi:hypothetical protein